MIRKTASRHLANLIGLTICQSAPRRRAHLVDTALPQAPWLRPLVLPPPPLLSLLMPEHLPLLHLAPVATLLLEVASAVLVAVAASELTSPLAAEEATVALVSVEAEAVVLLQVALAVGRAMSSTNNKTFNTKARLLDPEAPSLPKAPLHRSVKTATLPQPPTLAPNDSHQPAKPFPTPPQVPAPALLPAAPLHPTAVQPSPQSPPVPVPKTTATSPPAPPATVAANRKSTRTPLRSLPA